MKVTRALQPFIPLCQRLLPDLRTLPGILNLSSLPNLPGLPGLPSRLAGLSLTLLKATALDLAILAGHLLLYPSGIAQERRAAVRPALSGTPSAGDPPQLPTQAPPPVVLLHGFIDNRSVFVLLRRSLAQHGRHRMESLNYSPLTCDIRTAAELLGRHIEEICERTGSPQVDVVGHSLGGLIARYYVQRLGGDGRVRILVTLGTPHSGTRVAPLANAHPIVRQMRPGSAVIEELSRPAAGLPYALRQLLERPRPPHGPAGERLRRSPRPAGAERAGDRDRASRPARAPGRGHRHPAGPRHGADGSVPGRTDGHPQRPLPRRPQTDGLTVA